MSANAIAPSALHQPPLLTPTEILPPQQTGYSQIQGTNNCTITNAFETATNSGSVCSEAQASSGQSTTAEQLDEYFRKQLNLNADYGQQQQQQLVYTYFAPQQAYHQNPTFNNGGMGVPVQQQYLYYYAPVLGKFINFYVNCFLNG